jgi:hypothetical protein
LTVYRLDIVVNYTASAAFGLGVKIGTKIAFALFLPNLSQYFEPTLVA